MRPRIPSAISGVIFSLLFQLAWFVGLFARHGARLLTDLLGSRMGIDPARLHLASLWAVLTYWLVAVVLLTWRLFKLTATERFLVWWGYPLFCVLYLVVIGVIIQLELRFA